MDKRLTKIFPTRIVGVIQCANYSSQTFISAPLGVGRALEVCCRLISLHYVLMKWSTFCIYGDLFVSCVPSAGDIVLLSVFVAYTEIYKYLLHLCYDMGY